MKMKILAICLIVMVWLGNISLIVVIRMFGADFTLSTIISLLITTPPAILTSEIIWKHYSKKL
jgi:hypothetical protein